MKKHKRKNKKQLTASQMARRSWRNLTPEQRSARARHAVEARWNKTRSN